MQVCGIECRSVWTNSTHNRLDYLREIRVGGLPMIKHLTVVEGNYEMGLGHKPITAHNPNAGARKCNAEERDCPSFC